MLLMTRVLRRQVSQEMRPGFSAKSDDSIHKDGTSLTATVTSQKRRGAGDVKTSSGTADEILLTG